MPTSGYAKIGDKTIEFSPETAYMVMDWGRGVWPYRNTWYWETVAPDFPMASFLALKSLGASAIKITLLKPCFSMMERLTR